MTLTSSPSYSLACPPRYGTRRTPQRATLGPRLAAIAAELGKPLLPHQRYIADVALEIDPDTDLPAYGEVVLVGPRQCTGKTELLLPLMAHRCMGFGPMQRVLYTAQTADDARKKWKDVHLARLRASPLSPLVEERLRLNFEALIWPNGSMWSPGSTTGKTAGTGDTLDLAVIDEAWSRPDFRTELGLRPAMMTRADRQLWVASMVPGLSRALPNEWPYLEAKMLAGRAQVEAGINTGVAYFEWSAEPGLDPADPTTWWTCMPGLGHTVTEKTVREDFESMERTGRRIDFEAEYLGWIPQVKTRQWQVIRRAVWEMLLDATSAPQDPVALCIDAENDQSVTSIGLAALREDGDVHLEVVDRRPGMDWAVPRAVELCRQWLPCGLVVDPNGPATSLVQSLRNADIDTEIWLPNLKDVAAACSRFLRATGSVDPDERESEDEEQERSSPLRVRQMGQDELTTSVAGAVKRTFGAQWVWDRTPGGASALYTVTLALAAGERVDWLGGGYDIADSLG